MLCDTCVVGLCLCTRRCVASYPEETREVLDALYALWFDHLWDNIPTVREDSAVALAAAVKVYGQEALDKVSGVVRWVLFVSQKRRSRQQKQQ